MKNFKNILHYLLTIASVIGFLGGWATLAHSRKPAQTVSSQTQVVDPLPALAPIPDLGTTTGADNAGGLNIIAPSGDTTNQSNLNNTSNNSTTSISPVRPARRTRSLFTTAGS